MNPQRFDGRELVERLRHRHADRKAFLAGGKSIGVFGHFNSANTVSKGANNADIIATIATTNRVDLEREVVLPDGGVFDYLKTNRKIFVDHKYDHEYLVGGLRSWAPWPNKGTQRGWEMRVGVLMNHPYPVPLAVLNTAEQIGIGASIGFEALESGKPTDAEKKQYPGVEYVIRKWNCLEVSLTCLPCNVECQTAAGSMDGSFVQRARLLLEGAGVSESTLARLNLCPPRLMIDAA